jgi:Uma2 family endonuclease
MADLTLPRRLTYEDYAQFPNDGKRYEILEGEIYMSPSPTTSHQHASKRLQRILERYFEDRMGVEVYNAPLDVILADDDIVQPDLLVVERTQMSARGIEGAPLLLVEILSPSGQTYDRQTKARRYAAHGVRHYWIVDPRAQTLECFRLESSTYRLEASGAARDEVTVPSFDGLVVALEGLWLDGGTRR